MKKAISEIVSVVLLIMIVLVIAIIIMNFSKSFFNNKLLQKTSSYLYDAKIIDIKIDDSGELLSSPDIGLGQGQVLEIAVLRDDNEENLRGIRLVFEDNIDSYSYDVYDPPISGLVKVYKLTPDDVKIKDFKQIKKVSLILLDNNNNPTDILDEKELR